MCVLPIIFKKRNTTPSTCKYEQDVDVIHFCNLLSSEHVKSKTLFDLKDISVQTVTSKTFTKQMKLKLRYNNLLHYLNIAKP